MRFIRASWAPEDVVGADPSPDHVRMPRDQLGVIRKRRSAIRGSGDLPYPGLSLDALDAKLWRERLADQSRDEQPQGAEECLSLLGSKALPVSEEARQLFVGRHPQSDSGGGTLSRCAMNSSVLR